MKFSTLALAAIGAVDARIHFFDSCPKVEYAQNFDKNKFAGNWYEVLRDSEFFYETGHECVTHQYNMQKDGSLGLYFRAWAWQWAGYNGIGGSLKQCGESDVSTCLASMGDKEKALDELSPYNIIYVNDDHTVAVNY